MAKAKPKKIYYFGEDKDTSDKWLIKVLKDHFRVILIKPGQAKITDNFSYIINRLYVSAYKRYDKKEINNLLRKIHKLEKRKDIRIINSFAGFLLEYDRIKQYNFFNANKIPYVLTKSLIDIRKNKLSKFPIILKNNHSGRNKKLEIVNNFSDLTKISTSFQKNKVVQEFINQKICYRTEFINNTLLTFAQKIHIRNNKLSFQCIPNLIKTPLSLYRTNKISSVLNKIGVQVFSVEYFIIKNNLLIIDFNLSSNYKSFLIKKKGEIIKKSWLNLLT